MTQPTLIKGRDPGFQATIFYNNSPVLLGKEPGSSRNVRGRK